MGIKGNFINWLVITGSNIQKKTLTIFFYVKSRCKIKTKNYFFLRVQSGNKSNSIKENHRNSFGLDNDAHDFLHCSRYHYGGYIHMPPRHYRLSLFEAIEER